MTAAECWPTMEEMDATQQFQDKKEVWSDFEKSVKYLNELAAVYDSSFRSPLRPSSSVTAAHVQTARAQTQQALELLATNVMNVCTVLNQSLEEHEDTLVDLARSVQTLRTSMTTPGAAHDCALPSRQPLGQDVDGASSPDREVPDAVFKPRIVLQERRKRS